MLFGRLRVPFERLAAEPRVRSLLRVAQVPRGDSPRRTLLGVAVHTDDDYVGLEHLDREELDE